MGAQFSEPEFGELPPAHKGGRPVGSASERIAAALREKPGQWAKLGAYENTNVASARASQIRGGRFTAWQPAGAFEVTCRGGDLWARYVGDPS